MIFDRKIVFNTLLGTRLFACDVSNGVQASRPPVSQSLFIGRNLFHETSEALCATESQLRLRYVHKYA